MQTRSLYKIGERSVASLSRVDIFILNKLVVGFRCTNA